MPKPITYNKYDYHAYDYHILIHHLPLELYKWVSLTLQSKINVVNMDMYSIYLTLSNAIILFYLVVICYVI